MPLPGDYPLKMKVLFNLFLFVFLLSSCSKTDKPVSIFEEQMLVMGTIVNVTIAGETDKKSQKAFHDLLTDFKYMQAAWNPWKKGSLARINQLLPMGAGFSIGPALRDMLIKSRELEAKSQGLFNPAIGKFVKLWQFNQDEMPSGPPPSKEQIEKLLATHPQLSDLTLNGLTLKSSNPDVILDFGGFAKGYAVDKAIEHLKDLGIKNAIVNAGGDLRAIGNKGGKPWVIGIRNPRAEGVIASLEINGDESVFTSGDYERFYEYQGKRYHHILDPRTGYPADKTSSVTVVHHNAAIADAAATALFVAGPEQWESIAQKMGVSQVMLIDKSGQIYISPQLNKRIKFLDRDQLKITVSRKFDQ